MAGVKGRSGGARPGAGRPRSVCRLAIADPARAMDYLEALFDAAMKGRVGAAREYLVLSRKAGNAAPNSEESI